ncbi:unnamed protein product [Clonostachys rosea]|uniref:Zn(2)-C6 fungal-type domain-containing protein n=1 Tax=Bionectria ochroleuca TaxID=29856 RepID=A0ABY6TZQ0_BIOOC|nr:unnamed protein product [Clonostachys rosea]
MPFSRKKSCNRCRVSKLSCDRSLPACARCARKDAQCIYDGQDSNRLTPYSRSAPISSGQSRQEFSHISADVVDTSSTLQYQDLYIDHFDSITGDTLSWEVGLDEPELFDLPQTNLSSPNSRLRREDSEKFTHPFSIGEKQSSPEDSPPSTVASPLGPALANTSQCCHDTQLIPSGHTSKRVCLKKRRIVTDCVLSAVVMGQLTSFPKMMAKGDRLPPFIKPPCHLNEELAPECAARGQHQCLPKDLAICAGLIEMFQTRTAANKSYVWDMIYMEARRLRKEVYHRDAQGKLEVIQCLTVFLLLQADDPETVETNDVAYLLTTSVNILRSLLPHSNWNSESSKIRPSQGEWVFRESIRRVMAVYGVVDLFLDGIGRFGNDETYNCGALSLLPLPCVRDIWEATTVSGWIREYDQYFSTKEYDSMLITQSLMETRLVAPFVSAESGDPSNDIMQWCKGMDALGTIIWMIIPLHKYRLREDVRDIW